MNAKGYIHISQATKQYDKTRQTFYNYINKNLIDTKKINNKLFLKVADIERLHSDYLPDEKEKQAVSTEKQATSGYHQLPKKLMHIETGVLKNNSQLAKLRTELGDHFEELKDELFYDAKNKSLDAHQASQHSQHHFNDLQESLSTIINTRYIQHYLLSKKYLFALGYMVFALLNLVVLSLLY